MSKSITLAARVDADLDAELSQLAAKTGRTKSWLITEALRSFVANEQQFLAAVEEGVGGGENARLDGASRLSGWDNVRRIVIDARVACASCLSMSAYR